MDDVLRKADVISLHLILDRTTYHLRNAEMLSIMRKEAILVNANKGLVVDKAVSSTFENKSYVQCWS